MNSSILLVVVAFLGVARAASVPKTYSNVKLPVPAQPDKLKPKIAKSPLDQQFNAEETDSDDFMEFTDSDPMPCPLEPGSTDGAPSGECAGTGPTCIRSCDGLPHGDYQSCDTCNGFVKCYGFGSMLHQPCSPLPVLVWDDETGRCEWLSNTCTPCFTPVEVKTYEFDFRAVVPDTDGERFSWLVAPVAGEGECSSTGVLKIEPPNCATAVSIQMTIKQWYRFTFHLGGTEFNDGYAQHIFRSNFGKYDSEVHNYDNAMFAFSSSEGNLTPYSVAMPTIPDNSTVRLCLTITPGKFYWTADGIDGITIIDEHFFGMVTPLYLGTNRVIGSAHLDVEGGIGSGMCAATVTWTCDELTPPP